MASAAGPATHYELFDGLRAAAVSYLVTGATALTLHGVPRITPDIDLVVDPDDANLDRLRQRLAAWGYAQTPSLDLQPPGVCVRRFRHPVAALERIDVVTTSSQSFEQLRAGAESVTLVDLEIPLVGAADMRSIKEQDGPFADRDGAAGLATLASVQAGQQGCPDDTGREQIRKFSRWSVAARLDWLLAAARLGKGLSPEAKPMTRGLVRRHGWTRYGR